MRATAEVQEAFRLTELLMLAILDTSPEPEYEALVKMSSSLFKSAFSTVTLVDTDRQWFKARAGIAVNQTPRDISICQHAIKSDRPLLINDTLEDSRVCDSPLVKSAPSIRSYLGVPLRSVNQARIGTFCVMDSVAREWTQEEVQLASQFASIAEMLIHKHENPRATHAFESAQYIELEHVPAICGAWETTSDSEQVRLSPGLRQLFGLPPQTPINMHWFARYGVNRSQVMDRLVEEPNGKSVLEYNFIRPGGVWLLVEESIYSREEDDNTKLCGLVRWKNHNRMPSQEPSANRNSWLNEESNPFSALDCLTVWPTGFLLVDEPGLVQKFYLSSNESNQYQLLPVPLEECFKPIDRVNVRNEWVAAKTGLRTKTIFVRNPAKGNDTDWLKLKFLRLAHESNDTSSVLLQFTQLREWTASPAVGI